MSCFIFEFIYEFLKNLGYPIFYFWALFLVLQMLPAFSILFVSCRCNLLSLWWYSWGLFIQLPPASCTVCFLWVPFLWLFWSLSFMSPAFLRCQWPWLFIFKHESLQSWLNAVCRGAYVSKETGLEVATVGRVASITIYRPFVWGYLVPREEPSVSCLGWRWQLSR